MSTSLQGTQKNPLDVSSTVFMHYAKVLMHSVHVGYRLRYTKFQEGLLQGPVITK